jgi:general secretion pathway protein A
MRIINVDDFDPRELRRADRPCSRCTCRSSGFRAFAITPDPRYLFLSERHAEALAHLLYGISEAGGFVQLTGEVGTARPHDHVAAGAPAGQLGDRTDPEPGMNAPEFVLTICEELGIMVPNDAIGSVKDLIDILNRYLLRAHAQGKRVVLVVDEAQNLTPELLEQVRLLTNLETDTQKLLQIILIGQPELRDLLARNDLRQLAQRVTGRYHLDPLSRSESAAYVKHRLRIAGATSDIFTSGALAELYRCSGGVPRLLNIISDRALLGGYTEDRHEITAAMVRRAAMEVFDRRITPRWLPWALGAATLIVVAGGVLAAWSLYQRSRTAEPAPPGSPEVTAGAGAQSRPPPTAPTAGGARCPRILRRCCAIRRP